MIPHGGRYRYSEGDRVQTLLSEQEGVKMPYVRIYAAPADRCISRCWRSRRRANRSSRAIPLRSRRARGKEHRADVIRVPLMKDKAYAHDVRRWRRCKRRTDLHLQSQQSTGTLTPASDIEWLVENKPKGAIVMIDEAYTHIAGAPFHSNLVAKDKDVVILRTFSKIYGMAGLRAGAAIARRSARSGSTSSARP